LSRKTPHLAVIRLGMGIANLITVWWATGSGQRHNQLSSRWVHMEIVRQQAQPATAMQYARIANSQRNE